MTTSKQNQDGTQFHPDCAWKWFYNRKIWIIVASGWLFKKKSITMHGNMNVKSEKVSSHSECTICHSTHDTSVNFGLRIIHVSQ